MPAYIIANIRTLDTSDSLAEYRRLVLDTIKRYGGDFAVRGGQITVVEGDWVPVHLSLIAFPSGDQARAWLNSPEYQAILPLRAAEQTDLVLLEGPDLAGASA